jgi:hypothetical protein
MINELQGVWKEMVVDCSMYYNGICLEGNYLRWDIACPGRDSNRTIPYYQYRAAIFNRCAAVHWCDVKGPQAFLGKNLNK